VGYLDESFRNKAARAATPVWVWDGDWWPAIVAKPGRRFESLIVRLQNGVTVPVKKTRLQPRDPMLKGEDKPKRPCP
jgi:hypothetical protein